MSRSVIVKAGTSIPAEPLTLAEAKQHLRIDSDVNDQDTLITALIEGAREWPEHPAFGHLSSRDWGALVHRHVDHHLRQFGA